jgi:hypothetical protein
LFPPPSPGCVFGDLDGVVEDPLELSESVDFFFFFVVALSLLLSFADSSSPGLVLASDFESLESPFNLVDGFFVISANASRPSRNDTTIAAAVASHHTRPFSAAMPISPEKWTDCELRTQRNSAHFNLRLSLIHRAY